MPDYRVDDQEHAKTRVREVGLAALCLHFLAGSWSMCFLTDGWVPAWYVRSFPNHKRLIARLLNEGMWVQRELNGVPGYQATDWDDKQRSAADIQSQRDANAERMRALRAGKSGQRAATRAEPQQAHVQPHEQRTFGARSETVTPAGVWRTCTTPSPSPYGGHPGEGGAPLARAGAITPAPTSRQCSEHAEMAPEDVPPCRACAKAREAAEAAEHRAEADADRAMRACGLCDGEGFRFERGTRVPMQPPQRCDHQRSSRREAS